MRDEYLMNVDTLLKKLCYVGVLEFATVDEEGAPQVRNISAFTFDGTNMYFLPVREKALPVSCSTMAESRFWGIQNIRKPYVCQEKLRRLQRTSRKSG